jgi:hypothetical protein
MKYNLESMLPEKAFSPRGGRGPFSRGMTLEGGGGGPSAPTSSTTVTSNIPEYAEPYVTNMLDLTQSQLFKTDSTGITGFEPYQPYSTNVQDYFAGFSPLQKQAQIDAGAMQQPGQFALGSGLAGSAGIRSLGAAGQYGQDVTNKQRVDATGKPMFDPVTNQPLFDASNITQSFMSPYQQNVTDVAKASAVREAQMAQNAQNLGAARQGTYGGARQTLANMERERNLLSNLSNIQTQGAQSAYDRAMQTQQFGAGLGMQGYNQALNAGSQLAQIGATQQGTDIARQNQMAAMGQQQQGLEQNRINQAIQDYSTQQQYPLMQLGFMSNMLRGLPMEGLSRQTYAPQPSYLTQGIGTVGALGSLANVFKGREGGLPKEFESTTGIKSYNVGGSVGGSVESKLQDMSPAELQSYIKETSSPMARQIAEKVLRDKVGRAGGGIIAFQNRGEVEDKDEKKGKRLIEEYEKELAEAAARKFEFGDPKLLSDATPRSAPAPAVEQADPASVRQAQIDAALLEGGNKNMPKNLQYVEGVTNRKQFLNPSSPAALTATRQNLAGTGLSFEEDQARQILNRQLAESGAKSKSAQAKTFADLPDDQKAKFFAAIESKTPTAKPKEAGIKAASKDEPKAGTKSAEARAETKAESKAESKAAPATTGGGTGIKAVPSGKIMPTAGLTLPSSLDAPFGLEAPVNPDANKTIAQIAAEKEAYMGPNIAAQQDRARLMAEKVNAKEEARRATSMRMAEFFAAWGSTPGSTIVAGLYTLRNKIPDFISDEKEEAKIRKAIDKDIAELDKIDRLEKSGNYDQAAKRKAELSKESLDTWGKKVTAASNKYVADVGLQAAGIRAAASGSGGGGDDKTLANLMGKRNDINKAITTATDKLRTGVKLKAAQPDSPDSKEQEKILAARAEVAKATGSLENDLKQINNLISTYQKVQGLNTSAPGNDPLNIRKP